MSKSTNNNKKKVKALLCGATIIGVVGISGIFAYLTDTATKDNKFTVGSVEIELLEPSFDKEDYKEGDDNGPKDANNDGIPDHAENLSANQEVKKDPKIKNVGKNGAYVFLKVTVPRQSVITVDDNGNVENSGSKSLKELFTYDKNEKWTEITAVRQDKENCVEHVYYYNEILKPQQETEPLFSKVKLINVKEDEITTTGDGDEEGKIDLDIKIDAYAIQSDNIPPLTVEEQSEGTLTIQEKAYNIYTNQKGQS